MINLETSSIPEGDSFPTSERRKGQRQGSERGSRSFHSDERLTWPVKDWCKGLATKMQEVNFREIDRQYIWPSSSGPGTFSADSEEPFSSSTSLFLDGGGFSSGLSPTDSSSCLGRLACFRVLGGMLCMKGGFASIGGCDRENLMSSHVLGEGSFLMRVSNILLFQGQCTRSVSYGRSILVTFEHQLPRPRLSRFDVPVILVAR
jgi:hypothetical protein